MQLPRLQPHFPLLARELADTAARKATYTSRVFFGGAMFIVALVVLKGIYKEFGPGDPRMFGKGRELFEVVVLTQMAIIALFTPMLFAPAVAAEIEHKTLPLLIISDLRPWEILLQKYLGKLVPILSFLFLAVPLTALAYMLGGLDGYQIIAHISLVLMAAFLFGAVCLLISCACKTVSGATIACFLIGPVLMGFTLYTLIALGNGFGLLYANLAGWPRPAMDFLGKDPMAIFAAFQNAQDLGGLGLGLCFALPWAGVLCVYLSLAHKCLIGRGHASRTESLKQGSGVMHVPARLRPLPDDEPIAWRMRFTRMGRSGRLTWGFFIGMGVVIVFAAILNQSGHASGDSLGLAAMIGMVSLGLLGLGMLMVAVQASESFSAERSMDTLNVLLTTPLTGRELLRQKMVLPRRWTWAIGGAIFTLAALRLVIVLWSAGNKLTALSFVAPATVSLLLAVVIYLPLTAWLSLYIGLFIESHGRATSTTVTVLCAWCLGGFALPAVVLESLAIRGDSPWQLFQILSPVAAPMTVEEMGSQTKPWGLNAWWVIAINYSLYGLILWRFRRHILRNADGYLGRAQSPAHTPPAPPPAPEVSEVTA